MAARGNPPRLARVVYEDGRRLFSGGTNRSVGDALGEFREKL
jgi:hypothetical protein